MLCFKVTSCQVLIYSTLGQIIGIINYGHFLVLLVSPLSVIKLQSYINLGLPNNLFVPISNLAEKRKGGAMLHPGNDTAILFL